jgi:hypothetical protein
MNDENKIDDIKMSEPETKQNEQIPFSENNEESDKIRESSNITNVQAQNQNIQHQNTNGN